MGKGNYTGGSTVLRGFSAKADVRSGTRLSKREKMKRQRAPGFHVLSKEDRKEIFKKVRKSRKEAERAEREKGKLEQDRKKEAFAKFKSQMLNRTK
jgi:hypothetical protein